MIHIRPNNIKRPPRIFKKAFTCSSHFFLAYGIHKHPERQYCGDSMDAVSNKRVFTPGLFFFAEHARSNADNSGKLEDEKGHSSDPPSHNMPSLLFIPVM
jgi:hypothetical protein